MSSSVPTFRLLWLVLQNSVARTPTSQADVFGSRLTLTDRTWNRLMMMNACRDSGSHRHSCIFSMPWLTGGFPADALSVHKMLCERYTSICHACRPFRSRCRCVFETVPVSNAFGKPRCRSDLVFPAATAILNNQNTLGFQSNALDSADRLTHCRFRQLVGRPTSAALKQILVPIQTRTSRESPFFAESLRGHPSGKQE